MVPGLKYEVCLAGVSVGCDASVRGVGKFLCGCMYYEYGVPRP